MNRREGTIREGIARILVVDDEPAIRELLAEILESVGHDVVRAENGKQGLLRFREGPVDLVLSDIKMPEMGGVDMAREIHDARPDLPVLLVTGQPEIETAREAINLGVDDYILKPFNASDVCRSVARSLELRRNRRKLEEQYRQLLDLDRVKTVLSDIILQDLDMPLSQVRVGLDLLLDRASGPLNDEQEELLEGIRIQVERTLQRTRRLWTLRQAEAHDLLLRDEAVDPVSLLAEVRERVLRWNPECGGEIRLDPPRDLPGIRGDRDQLFALFLALIERSLRRTSAGGEVVVRVESTDGTLHVRIVDPVGSIPAGREEQAFTTQGQAELAADGIRIDAAFALPFAREVARAHGGDVTLERENEGCVFEVRLPASEE